MRVGGEYNTSIDTGFSDYSFYVPVSLLVSLYWFLKIVYSVNKSI